MPTSKTTSPPPATLSRPALRAWMTGLNPMERRRILNELSNREAAALLYDWVWNAAVPEVPMPAEVAAAVGAVIAPLFDVMVALRDAALARIAGAGSTGLGAAGFGAAGNDPDQPGSVGAAPVPPPALPADQR